MLSIPLSQLLTRSLSSYILKAKLNLIPDLVYWRLISLIVSRRLLALLYHCYCRLGEVPHIRKLLQYLVCSRYRGVLGLNRQQIELQNLLILAVSHKEGRYSYRGGVPAINCSYPYLKAIYLIILSLVYQLLKNYLDYLVYALSRAVSLRRERGTKSALYLKYIVESLLKYTRKLYPLV